MNLQLKSAELRLKNGNLLTLDDSQHVSVDCLEGSLWITQDGDPRDVILSAGRSFRIDRTSRVMVFATSDARLLISSKPAHISPTAKAAPGWFARLGGAGATPTCASQAL
jgi:hypothetical protein